MENTFLVNSYPTVRIEFLARGWTEFSHSDNRHQQQLTSEKNRKKDRKLTPEEDKLETQKNQKKFPYFIWELGRERINFRNLQPEQIVNHFSEALFTTKIGLCQCLQDVHWFEDVDSDNFFPRCYRIGLPHQNKTFVEDYRLTSCINILKWLVDYLPIYSLKDDSQSEKNVVIPNRAIEAILRHCELFIRTKQNQPIDLDKTPFLTDNDWLFLLEWYNQLMNRSVMIRNAMAFYEPCVRMLQRMIVHWPQLLMDGKLNLWIVKPAAKARGKEYSPVEEGSSSNDNKRHCSSVLVYPSISLIAGLSTQLVNIIGIRIVQNFKDILMMSVEKSSDKGVTHIVQKYIERPLLIEGTKFDIRQWFLVTGFDELTIYVYKDCYIRFCSQPFSLLDSNEYIKNCVSFTYCGERLDLSRNTWAVHLCNNAVQRRYMKYKRNAYLIPPELMWTSDQFKDYLKNQGMVKMWDSYIYPAMKNAIVTTVQSAFVSLPLKQNCFELFGADFLLSEDFHPWLLEINSDPCLAPTTNVTAKLCSNVIRDTLRVVLDHSKNPEFSTGRFECVYKQSSVPSRDFIGISLKLKGIVNPKPILNPINSLSPKINLSRLDLSASLSPLTPSSSPDSETEEIVTGFRY